MNSARRNGSTAAVIGLLSLLLSSGSFAIHGSKVLVTSRVPKERWLLWQLQRVFAKHPPEDIHEITETGGKTDGRGPSFETVVQTDAGRRYLIQWVQGNSFYHLKGVFSEVPDSRFVWASHPLVGEPYDRLLPKDFSRISKSLQDIDEDVQSQIAEQLHERDPSQIRLETHLLAGETHYRIFRHQQQRYVVSYLDGGKPQVQLVFRAGDPQMPPGVLSALESKQVKQVKTLSDERELLEQVKKSGPSWMPAIDFEVDKAEQLALTSESSQVRELAEIVRLRYKEKRSKPAIRALMKRSQFRVNLILRVFERLGAEALVDLAAQRPAHTIEANPHSPLRFPASIDFARVTRNDVPERSLGLHDPEQWDALSKSAQNELIEQAANGGYPLRDYAALVLLRCKLGVLFSNLAAWFQLPVADVQSLMNLYASEGFAGLETRAKQRLAYLRSHEWDLLARQADAGHAGAALIRAMIDNYKAPLGERKEIDVVASRYGPSKSWALQLMVRWSKQGIEGLPRDIRSAPVMRERAHEVVAHLLQDPETVLAGRVLESIVGGSSAKVASQRHRASRPHANAVVHWLREQRHKASVKDPTAWSMDDFPAVAPTREVYEPQRVTGLITKIARLSKGDRDHLIWLARKQQEHPTFPEIRARILVDVFMQKKMGPLVGVHGWRMLAIHKNIDRFLEEGIDVLYAQQPHMKGFRYNTEDEKSLVKIESLLPIGDPRRQEIQVVRLLALGHSLRFIYNKTGISEERIKNVARRYVDKRLRMFEPEVALVQP